LDGELYLSALSGEGAMRAQPRHPTRKGRGGQWRRVPSSIPTTDPVDAERLIYGGTWNGLVGVEGGIPSGSWVRSGSLLGTSTSLATLNSALSSAADDTYVELDAGTFNFAGSVLITNTRVELRGQVDGNGVPTTILNFSGATEDGLLTIRSGTGWDISNTGSFTTRNVSSPSGASLRGAANLTLASAPTGMTVNQPIFFSDDSQGGSDFYGFGSSGAGRTWMHWARVTAITGSDITISPPINADYLTGTLQCHYKAGGGMLRLSGAKNLIIQGQTGARGVKFNATDECWLYNVTVAGRSGGSGVHHIDTYCNFRLQIDHCECHDMTTQGNSAYCLNAYAGGSWLVVNNYFHDIPNVMPMFGLHGSAFAYNYINALGYSSPTGWLSQIVFDHGAMQDYNLYEGNWLAQSYNDASSTARNTIFFRNRMRSHDTDAATGVATSNRNCLTQEAGYSYRVMAGNVLGENGVHSTVLRTFTTGNENNDGAIYNLNTDADDLVERIGNYNTVDDAVPAGEALAAGEALVTSYLYSAKPSWFGALPWPWCTPTDFTQSNDVENFPAGYRATNGVDP
jgi:hypothetical protein